MAKMSKSDAITYGVVGLGISAGGSAVCAFWPAFVVSVWSYLIIKAGVSEPFWAFLWAIAIFWVGMQILKAIIYHAQKLGWIIFIYLITLPAFIKIAAFILSDDPEKGEMTPEKIGITVSDIDTAMKTINETVPWYTWLFTDGVPWIVGIWVLVGTIKIFCFDKSE